MVPDATQSTIVVAIARELGVASHRVAAAVALLDEGSTVSFIARYRKEATGNLDDTQLRTLEERLLQQVSTESLEPAPVIGADVAIGMEVEAFEVRVPRGSEIPKRRDAAHSLRAASRR